MVVKRSSLGRGANASDHEVSSFPSNPETIRTGVRRPRTQGVGWIRSEYMTLPPKDRALAAITVQSTDIMFT